MMNFSEHQQKLRETIQEGEAATSRAAKFAATMAARVGQPMPRYPIEDHQNERVTEAPSVPESTMPVFIDPRMMPFFQCLVEIGKVAEAALEWMESYPSSSA
jgi:hypothetical protein